MVMSKNDIIEQLRKVNMSRFIEKVKEKIDGDVFTDAGLTNALGGTANSRNSAVRRAVKAGDIIRLKRGLYVLGAKHQRKGVSPFQAAPMIYGPSYVSLESALSYHGWIPEAVHAVTSVSTKRSKEVKTPLGIFSYARIPSHKFFSGVSRIESENGVFLMATPWRALVDYVYVHKEDWKGLRPVVESLRVDTAHFKGVDFRSLEELREATRSKRVKVFIDRIKKELVA